MGFINRSAIKAEVHKRGKCIRSAALDKIEQGVLGTIIRACDRCGNKSTITTVEVSSLSELIKK